MAQNWLEIKGASFSAFNHAKLEIAPNVGASIKSLSTKQDSSLQNLMRVTPDSALTGNFASSFSSFTLAPFSNRIRDAKFVFENQEHQLKASAKDGSTQHGDVRNRPWNVTRAENTLECSFDSRDVADFNFPFPIRMKVLYVLKDSIFETHLELENVGSTRMPAGFGLHPYFVRQLNASNDLQLQFGAAGIYETDSSFIPNKGMIPIPENFDFSKARFVGNTPINHVFGGWNGSALLEYDMPESSSKTLKLEASEVFSHLCVFASPDGALAVEPISHCTDGFNLMARGIENTGVKVLKPGEKLTGWVRLSLQG
jgi:aldose 1-epimerase